ncbi:hypothetical protein OMW_01273, partial [Enterococcus columbae DSM 7374 = ATCC 51263]
SVSPYTGEWIEITDLTVTYSAGLVSPYTGEWIEILFQRLTLKPRKKSHLTQVSGLK